MYAASAAGFLLLTVAFVACGFGLLTREWISLPADFAEKSVFDQATTALQPMFGEGSRVSYEGVFRRCYFPPDNRCIWLWHKEMEKETKDLHKVAQNLYGFGFMFLVWTLQLALIHLFCRCCCRKPFSLTTVLSYLSITASMLVAAAIAVFMAFLIKEFVINIEDLTGSKGKPRFGWACFVAVGGVACALISSVFFIYEGCRQDGSRSYDGYETARTI